VKNGLVEGVARTYFENGKVQYEWRYFAGRLHGVTKEYNLDGKLMAEWCYLRGKLAGVCKTYCADGKVRTDMTFKRGHKSGPATVYGEDGSPMAVLQYAYDPKEFVTSREDKKGDIIPRRSSRDFRQGWAILTIWVTRKEIPDKISRRRELEDFIAADPSLLEARASFQVPLDMDIEYNEAVALAADKKMLAVPVGQEEKSSVERDLPGHFHWEVEGILKKAVSEEEGQGGVRANIRCARNVCHVHAISRKESKAWVKKIEVPLNRSFVPVGAEKESCVLRIKTPKRRSYYCYAVVATTSVE
jgi:hypothetical protein